MECNEEGARRDEVSWGYSEIGPRGTGASLSQSPALFSRNKKHQSINVIAMKMEVNWFGQERERIKIGHSGDKQTCDVMIT